MDYRGHIWITQHLRSGMRIQVWYFSSLPMILNLHPISMTITPQIICLAPMPMVTTWILFCNNGLVQKLGIPVITSIPHLVAVYTYYAYRRENDKYHRTWWYNICIVDFGHLIGWKNNKRITRAHTHTCGINKYTLIHRFLCIDRKW